MGDVIHKALFGAHSLGAERARQLHDLDFGLFLNFEVGHKDPFDVLDLSLIVLAHQLTQLINNTQVCLNMFSLLSL